MTTQFEKSGTSEDALEHYGVPGMKWGRRKASSGGGSSGPSRKELRAKNRAGRRADRQANFAKDKAKFQSDVKKRDKDIDDARNSLDSKYDKVKSAKKTYKEEKQVIGSYEAKKKVKAARAEFNEAAKKAYKNKSDEDYDQALEDLGYGVVQAILYG